MDREVEIYYWVEGQRLHPSNPFYRMLITFTDSVRHSTEMQRLGLLTEQLRPYEEYVLIEEPSDVVTNEDLKIFPRIDSPLPLPQKVTDRIEVIERSVRGEDDRLIINNRTYEESVRRSVLWLLNELREELSDGRKEIIGKYCRLTGLTGHTAERTKSNEDPWEESRGIDVDLTNVSKL